MTHWTIREETAADVGAIRAVTTAAFTDHPHSAGAEPAIVAQLRENGDLALSLVVLDEGGAIVGHAAWSPAHLSTGDKGWMTLGPISVVPERQRQGVGRALIKAGNARLLERGASGVVLLGEPGYYERFGFRRDTALFITGLLARYFQALPFLAHVPAAEVSFVPAFELVALRDRGTEPPA